jgi:hypothetical protein
VKSWWKNEDENVSLANKCFLTRSIRQTGDAFIAAASGSSGTKKYIGMILA